MKVKTLATLLSLSILVSCVEIPGTEIIKQAAATKKEEKPKPPKDGVFIQEKDRSGTKVEIAYKDGKKHGLSKEYYPNGQLWKETEYEAGRLHGVAKVYNREGKITREVHYKDGKKHGPTVRYFKSGNVKSRVEYNEELIMPGGMQKNYQGEVIQEPRISVKHRDELQTENQYHLIVGLDPDVKITQFYAFDKPGMWKPGERIDVYRLPSEGKNTYRLTIPLARGFMMAREIYFYATYKSKWGDPMVVSRKVNLAIENP